MILNGLVVYAPDSAPNYSLGTVATYSCNTSYFLNVTAGSEMRTCIDDGDNDVEGIFNHTAPTCDRKSMALKLVNQNNQQVNLAQPIRLANQSN